jgi:HlyD family secretion protein
MVHGRKISAAAGQRGFSLLWGALGILAVCCVVAAAFVFLRRAPGAKAAETPPPSAPAGIAARGRIEPEGGLIRVTAPYIAGRPSLISELKVREGDTVQAGQVLAILDSRNSLDAAWKQAQARVTVSRSRLAQVKAGARAGDVAAQKMEIGRWQAEVENAESEYQRYEKLHRTRDVSTEDLEAKRLARERARKTLQWAKDRLTSLEEVRGTDVDLAQSELLAAQAEEQRLHADLESATVRAPAAGRVVKLLAHPGEDGSTRGMLELARTGRMYAVAEVYETDIVRVKLGQKAVITSDLISGKLQGTVTQIGMKVSKSEVLPLDPASFADQRVVLVKVLLADGERVSGLIDGKVLVVIEP